MKSKLLIYAIPVIIVSFLLVSFDIQDDPRNDAAPIFNDINYNQVQQDTNTPAGFPYPTLWNFNYQNQPGPVAGTVGACLYNGKYYLNRWNLATNYRYNSNGPNGGPGTRADSNTAYNGGTGAIRDMTVAPDGSGRSYLWGGAAGTVLYKLDSLANRVASYTHAGAVYRAIAWDRNRRGFWSCNFADNIVCRDTNGVVIKTLTNTLGGKYGLGFDSTSTADSAFLWVWSQSTVVGGPNELHRIHINSNTDTRTYLFPLVGALGIAGGAEVFTHNNQLVLSLNYQNFATVGYKLKDLSPPAGGSVTVCRRNIRKSIPENGGNANPGIDTIVIAGVPSGQFINRMTVKIDTLIHTYIGDLRFWLTKVGANRTDTLISRPPNGTGGNSCNDFIGTNLVDTATLTIQNIPSVCIGAQAQATGWFKPKEPLSVFNNIDPNGTYILRVSDNANIDTGHIKSWCITIEHSPFVGVSNNATIADSYELSQNYPNPFNPTTSINYSIPKSGLVTLKVFDILGKEVAIIVNEFKNAGNHDVNFNASSLSSGVYFYRIESGNFIDTKKMFLLK